MLVSLDSLGFYNNTAEPFRQAIFEGCQLKPSELFLCAIHTHSAPTLGLDSAKVSAENVAYTKDLQGRLVEVVRAALKALEPIQCSVCFGSSPVGVNRREVFQGIEREVAVERRLCVGHLRRERLDLVGARILDDVGRLGQPEEHLRHGAILPGRRGIPACRPARVGR